MCACATRSSRPGYLVPVYAAFPVAPPRLAGIGLVDTITHADRLRDGLEADDELLQPARGRAEPARRLRGRGRDRASRRRCATRSPRPSRCCGARRSASPSSRPATTSSSTSPPALLASALGYAAGPPWPACRCGARASAPGPRHRRRAPSGAGFGDALPEAAARRSGGSSAATGGSPRRCPRRGPRPVGSSPALRLGAALAQQVPALIELDRDLLAAGRGRRRGHRRLRRRLPRGAGASAPRRRGLRCG